jgi:hypothetical protein
MINKNEMTQVLFTILGIAIGLLVSLFVFLKYDVRPELSNCKRSLSEIESVTKSETIDTTFRLLAAEPEFYFDLLEDEPSWERTQAIPYSDCYRHLINDTVSNYIICKAI